MSELHIIEDIPSTPAIFVSLCSRYGKSTIFHKPQNYQKIIQPENEYGLPKVYCLSPYHSRHEHMPHQPLITLRFRMAIWPAISLDQNKEKNGCRLHRIHGILIHKFGLCLHMCKKQTSEVCLKYPYAFICELMLFELHAICYFDLSDTIRTKIT